MAPVKTFIVALFCSVVLLGAGTAHALSGSNGLSINALTTNGMAINGVALNGVAYNGLQLNGLTTNMLSVNGISVNGLAVNARSSEGVPVDGPREGLPLILMSQMALGKTLP